MLKSEADKLARRVRRDGFDAVLVYRDGDYSPWVVRVEVGAVIADLETPRQWAEQRETLAAMRGTVS
jgi:hypothetical protein